MMDGKVVKEEMDFRYLDWNRIRHSSGTAGSFLKAYEGPKSSRWYYKLSDFDAYHGIVGHECVNEIIADRLLTCLRVPHLSYTLIHARIKIGEEEYLTWLCRSRDYKKKGESKIALDTYYQMERFQDESPLAFCLRQGWDEYVYQMLAVDYLILNRDRHGANMEVLRDRTEHTIRLAPLFDHGLSLFFSVHTESELQREDPMADKRIQSFIGSNSARENLNLIPNGISAFPGKLRETDREELFADLEQAISETYLDRIWEMIWRRWQVYESICDSGR